jgi:gluconolactonase
MVATVFLAGATAAFGEPSRVMKPAANARIERLDPAINSLIAPGAAVEKVATGFVFLEGPMWHQGAIWFSDLRGNKMYKVSPDGKITMQLDHAGGLNSFPAGANGGSNAMVTDKDGKVLMEQHGARRIVKLDDAMHASVFLDKYDGKRFNSPNDMVFAPDGALWFTDPPYGFADPGNPNKDLDKDPAKQIKFNAVYRYKDGKVTPVITDLARPNGIAFSPDGKTLYISNTENNPMIFRYDVGADGKVSKRKILIDLTKAPGIGVPDGLRVDSKGDIWATGEGGIRIISPAGKVLGQIQLPEVAANLSWGGDDLKTVYIMGSTSLYRLKLLVAGEKPLYSN